MEKDWGCKLFYRYTHVVLTDTGRSLLGVLTKAFDDIRVEADLHTRATRKMVQIAVDPIFGSRWFCLRLLQFGKTHPDIDLVVHPGSRITSAKEMTTDISVDWGTGNWKDLDAIKLMVACYLPIVSPDLIAEHGDISKPSELAKHTLIHQHDHSEWRNWFAFAGCQNQTDANEVVVIDSNLVQQSVKDGQGVALGVFSFLNDDVLSRQLVKPFDIDLHPSCSYYLLTRKDVRMRDEVRTVCEWIEAEANEFNEVNSPN
ncbi:MAG: LysR substrate-binding domain-containing protein [Amylibacter sp.]